MKFVEEGQLNVFLLIFHPILWFSKVCYRPQKKKPWKHDHRLESFDPNVKVILEEYFQMSSLHVFYAIFEQ